LQRFLVRKSVKGDEFFSKEQLFDAPVLYKIPSHEDMKNMIKVYLEKKKIL